MNVINTADQVFEHQMEQSLSIDVLIWPPFLFRARKFSKDLVVGVSQYKKHS